jgi:hypothetical protein
MPNNIQPRDYSRGGDTDGFQTIRDRDGNPRLFNCNRNGAESWLNNNNGRDDNEWNWNNRFFLVRKSLISPLLFGGGVLFGNLSQPATEYSAYLIYLF